MFVLYTKLLRDWLSGVSWLRWVDSILGILDQITFRVPAAAILSFLLVVWFGKPVIAWLRRKKIGDTGLTDAAALQNAATSKKSTPTMGGLLIVGAIIASTLVLADFNNRYVILGLIVLVWLAVLGGIDDWLKLTAASRPGASRQGLRAWEKLVFQIGLGVLVAYFAYRQGIEVNADGKEVSSMAHVLNLPIQRTVVAESERGLRYLANPSLIYLGMGAFLVFGVLMIAGMSNAVNIADGMDGLATGVNSAVSIGLMVLALIAGNSQWANWLLVPHVPLSGELAVMVGAMAGASLGFLWYNCSPASVFMGDMGALALGGFVGYVAMVTRQEVVVLFMCGVFLIEIGSVMLQVGYFRLSGGKRIFKVAPLHHHLHLSGWTEQQIVARFWIISVLLVTIGLASIKMR